MGRVKRYKKLKAIDPCAPRRPNPDDEKYDLPPSSTGLEGFDDDDEGAVNGRKRRRQERRWEQDVLRDDEYVEQLEEKAKKGRKKQLPEISIQSRQPNESMKAFQHRVRLESRALLRESNIANSTTKARRREYMKKKKLEKKRKAKGLPSLHNDDAHDEEEDGWGRIPSFAKAERVSFGETNDAPPDLRVPRLPDKHKAAAKTAARAVASAGAGATGPQKEKNKKSAATLARAKQSPAEKAKWEKLREEAQQAYRAMKAAKEEQQQAAAAKTAPKKKK